MFINLFSQPNTSVPNKYAKYGNNKQIKGCTTGNVFANLVHNPVNRANKVPIKSPPNETKIKEHEALRKSDGSKFSPPIRFMS